MQEKKQFIRDQTGDSYIDIAIVMLIIFTLLASLLAVFPVLSVQQSLNNTTRQIARTVEVTGYVAAVSLQSPETLDVHAVSMDPDKCIIFHEITLSAAHVIC